MIGFLIRLWAVALLELHAVHWAHCPVCGTGHSTTSPGSPCSSRCSAVQRQRDAMGQEPLNAEPRYGSPGGNQRGKSKGPGPVPKKKGCDLVLLPAAAAAALVLARLIRRI